MFKQSTFKIFLIGVLLIIGKHTATAQELGLQISPGLINYGGDLQDKVYTFNQANFSFGAALLYRINKFSVRGGVNFGKVQADDKNSTRFKYRNLSFASGIVDGNLCLQYDFISIDNKKFTPYVFAGGGVFHFNPYTFYNSQKVYLQPLGTEGQGLAIYPDKKLYALTQFNIPLGIGVKYKLSEHFMLGLEFCSRFLFTDYLDDVSTKYPDQNELFKQRGQAAVDLSFRGNEIDPSLTFPSGAQRGNASHNDNYYTSSLTLIYIFPKQLLFGGEGSRNKHIKALNCPKHLF